MARRIRARQGSNDTNEEQKNPGCLFFLVVFILWLLFKVLMDMTQ
jgi:hypothetical protein